MGTAALFSAIKLIIQDLQITTSIQLDPTSHPGIPQGSGGVSADRRYNVRISGTVSNTPHDIHMSRHGT